MTAGFLLGVHPFLGITSGGAGEVMVVEGWIGTRQITQAVEAFRQGKYHHVVVVRDIYEDGDKWSSGRYSADYVAAELVQEGVPKDQVQVVFCPVVRKDRTYHCALAARAWLQQQGIPVKSLDVVTLATHARRSRLLYEKAFGDGVAVGVVALDDPTYDPDHWWRYSSGVREVMSETISYLYARLFFWPGEPPPVIQTPLGAGATGRAGSN